MAANVREHLEWLSLLDVSGPFLTIPVLRDNLPDGLDRIETSRLAALRAAFAAMNEGGKRGDAAIRAFVLFVLSDTLGYDASVLLAAEALREDMPQLQLPEMGETLRADYALLPPPDVDLDDLLDDDPPAARARAAMLIAIHPDAPLDLPMRNQSCSFSPRRRMAELCRSSGIPLGLVSNGEQFTLVYAPRGKTASFATWHASLWLEERVTLQSFVTLLHKRRFFAVADEQSLPRLMEQSANAQQDVTEKLGWQTRGALTEFIRAIDRIGRQNQSPASADARIVAGLDASCLYEAALTVMMRMVFLLSAEERGLLRLGDAFYDETYAISTMCQSLREMADKHGEEELEYRHDAWARLLALFRAVYGGVSHECLNFPAYGGSLFDPDKYPFLEGRAAGTKWRETPSRPLPINNRVVLHMLESLQFLRDRQTTGLDEAVRLSFRGLDVEQIGHVYEGLLDRTAARADQPLLGLIGKNEAWLPLAEAEALLQRGKDLLAGRLASLTGSTPAAMGKLLAGERKNSQAGASRLETLLTMACNGDRRLADRILPFAHLLRLDAFGLPVVVPQGGLYVTSGSQRRDSGAHYTPRHLTETLVAATLEPHVYAGPAQGLPRSQWRPLQARELLGLKVCDMAMGSGAFLVQACRYLSEKLLDAWQREKTPGLPEDAEERATLARRQIADHCLYGVDNNPLAVDMARLSLWLVTMRRDRPFTFLDHALRRGDALLGITDLRQLEEFCLFPAETEDLVFGFSDMRDAIREALQKRSALAAISSDSILDVERKSALLAEAEKAIARLRLRGDALIMEYVRGRGCLREANRYAMVDKLLAPLFRQNQAELAAWLEERRRTLVRGTGAAKAQKDEDNNPGFTRPFHWALEFPEVFGRENPGFDAIVGNPPFLGSQRMREALGNFYREYLIEVLGRGVRGETDLAAYFFLRAEQLSRKNGDFGLIATNTIGQGHTRKAGLLLLEQDGCKIRAAWPNVPWEGNATVTTSQLVIRNGSDWKGKITLSDEKTDAISSFLKSGREEWEPKKLKENENLVFMGTTVLGNGFIVTEEQAQNWITEDSKNSKILYPYLTGADITNSPEQTPSRWVINFFDWDIEVCKKYKNIFDHIERNVLPDRIKKRTKDTIQRWWQFTRPRGELYHAIGRGDLFKKHPKNWQSFPALKRILVISQVTKFASFCFVPNSYVMSARTCAFASADAEFFGLIQSSIHEAWVTKISTTLGTGLSYTPAISFGTFPRPAPEKLQPVREHAENLHALRRQIMIREQIGLTDLYNNMHNSRSGLPGMAELRASHQKLDELVAAAYGWDDLDMGHDFRQVEYLPKKDNIRHAIPEATRLDILRRLTDLNRQRWLEEQRPAAKGKKTGAGKRQGQKSGASQNMLY